jgi:hypothetical protein
MSKASEKHPNAEMGYDRSDPQILGVLGTTLAIVGTLVATMVGVNIYYQKYMDNLVQETVLEPVAQDLIDLREREAKQLHSYGMANKDTGTVRIPIERAMQLVASEAAEGKTKYPTAAYAVKKPEDAAAAAGAATPATPNAAASAPASK